MSLFYSEPNYVLCTFGAINPDNPAALSVHLGTIATMTREGYLSLIKDGLHILGGRHSHMAVQNVAAKNTAFQNSDEFKFCNPKIVLYFPTRNKYYVSLAW
ncbi:MAG TPA: hypothetical protein V6C97_16105 [Oculatellaceae cyanobacterium]